MRTKLLLTVAVSALALGTAACSLQIDQILAVQDGSQMSIDVATPFDLPPVEQTLEGGNVMSIDIQISLFDLILGDFEGDIAVVELLIAAPGVNILVPTGRICIIPDATNPGGGTFEANLHQRTATFDVALNTSAVFENTLLGSFPFPFALESTLPFGLAEMLGLLTGSTDLSITQPIDQPLAFNVLGIPITGQVSGEITLASADAFPTTPLLDECIAILGQ
jgi:hypothetical protein